MREEGCYKINLFALYNYGRPLVGHSVCFASLMLYLLYRLAHMDHTNCKIAYVAEICSKRQYIYQS